MYELLEEVILKISGKVNKKALRTAIKRRRDYDLEDGFTLNHMLKDYYDYIHNIDTSNTICKFFHVKDKDDFKDIKEAFNVESGVYYKKPYDYLNGGKIKQRNTGFVVVHIGAFMSRIQWVFNVYEYIKVMGYQEVGHGLNNKEVL